MKNGNNRIEVKFAGSRGYVDGENAVAGECERMVNLREKRDAVAAVGRCLEVGELAAGERLVAMHYVAGGRHLISAAGSTLYWHGTVASDGTVEPRGTAIAVGAAEIGAVAVVGDFVVAATASGNVVAQYDAAVGAYSQVDTSGMVPRLLLSPSGRHTFSDVVAASEFDNPVTHWQRPLPTGDVEHISANAADAYRRVASRAATEGYMVQPVLAAKSLKQGQLGANLTGWLKILDVPLYIVPGIICFALFPTLQNPDEAYMTLVTNLFPVGMVGMVMAVLTAALVSTVGSALNALSTVFTIDIYMKYRPKASEKEMISVGRLVTVVGAIISIVICIAIDSIKGLDLFNVFQSVLGFIAPPMAAVFLFGVFWKRATTRAANFALTFGTAFSLLVGVLYLWVFPSEDYPGVWPHFMMLSFNLFVAISVGMFIISMFEKKPQGNALDYGTLPKPSSSVVVLWVLLILVMIALYTFFNGH